MTQYELQHSQDGVTWSPSIVTEDTSFTLHGIPYGEARYARVRSRNPVSGEVSDWAPIVVATPTRPQYQQPDVLVPLNPPQVAFVQATSSVIEGFATNIVLSRTGPTDAPLTVLVQETDSTGGGDYDVHWPGGDVGLVVFESGNDRASITITTHGDEAVEPSDTAVFQIQTPPQAYYTVGSESAHTVSVLDQGGLTVPGEFWHDDAPTTPPTAPDGTHPVVHALDLAKANWTTTRPTEHDVIHVHVEAFTDRPLSFAPLPIGTSPDRQHYTPWWGDATLVLHGRGPEFCVFRAYEDGDGYGTFIDEPTPACAVRLVFVGFKFEGTYHNTIEVGHKGSRFTEVFKYIRFVGCHFTEASWVTEGRPSSTIVANRSSVALHRCVINTPHCMGQCLESNNPYGPAGLYECVVRATGGSVWFESYSPEDGPVYQPHVTTIDGTIARGHGADTSYLPGVVMQNSNRILEVVDSTILDVDKEDGIATPAIEIDVSDDSAKFLGHNNMGLFVVNSSLAAYQKGPSPYSKPIVAAGTVRSCRITDCAILSENGIAADSSHFGSVGINTPAQLALFETDVPDYRPEWLVTGDYTLGSDAKNWGPVTDNLSMVDGFVSKSAADLTPPTAPQITGTTPLRGRVTIDWSAGAGGPDVDGYRFWWRKSGEAWALHNTEMVWVEELAKLVSPPQYGPDYTLTLRRDAWAIDFTETLYEFRVEAFTNMHVFSVPSNTASETPLTPLQAPTNMTAVDVQASTASVTFTESPTIVGSRYLFELWLGGALVSSQEWDQGITQVDFNGLELGREYVVVAYQHHPTTGKRSPQSVRVAFTTLSTIAEPTGFRFTPNNTNHQAFVSWTPDGRSMTVAWGTQVVQVAGRNVVQFEDGSPAKTAYLSPGRSAGSLLSLAHRGPHAPGTRIYAQLSANEFAGVSPYTDEVRYIDLPNGQGVYGT